MKNKEVLAYALGLKMAGAYDDYAKDVAQEGHPILRRLAQYGLLGSGVAAIASAMSGRGDPSQAVRKGLGLGLAVGSIHGGYDAGLRAGLRDDPDDSPTWRAGLAGLFFGGDDRVPFLSAGASELGKYHGARYRLR